MHETRQIAFQLTEFLNEALCLSGKLKPETDLLDEGLVDSLMIMDLVEHIRATYGLRLSSADLRPQHFRSAMTLSELVAARLDAAQQVSMS